MNGKNSLFVAGDKFDVYSKKMTIALPDVPITAEQKKVIDDFIKHNEGNFTVNIVIVK